jgi:hypothetical protein
MTTITINTPVKVEAPRGAVWAATWFSKLLTGIDMLVESRVQRRLRTQRVAEANQVRQYAHEVMGQDRRFAADLLAAADRHELG